jgi:glucose 1-dehydrogenase
MSKLAGKIAIVTGAARGIGLACAKRFIVEGAKVVLADIDERGAVEVKHLGDKARFVRCDVGEAKDAANLIAEACKAFNGDIDILVNNAGIVHGADFIDLKESDFDRVLRTNLKGAFLVGQLAARTMIEQAKAGKKPGAIVNMASINSTVAIANQVPYSASKGALLQLTRTMALAPNGNPRQRDRSGIDHDGHSVGGGIRRRGEETDFVAHTARPHRRAGRGRFRRGFSRLGRRQLHHG